MIKLDEILSVKYLSGFEWAPDGSKMLYKYNDGGITDVYHVDVKTRVSKKISSASSGVSDFVYTSYGIILIEDGNVVIYDEDFNKEMITTLGGIRPKLALSKCGNKFAFTDGKSITFYSLKHKRASSFMGLGEVFAGRFSQTVGMDAFDFSPNGKLFLYTFLDKTQKPFLAIATNQGKHVWQSDGHKDMIEEGKWLDNTKFIYRISGRFRANLDYYIATIPHQEDWKDYSVINAVSQFVIDKEHILSVGDELERGSFYANVTPNMKRNELLFGLENDGYFHYYTYSLKTKILKQLTYGECEDIGQMGDSISISPSGSKFVYASNKEHRIERQLYEYDLESHSERKITDFSLTNLAPKYSPDGSLLAFMHCSKKENGDLWFVNLDKLECQQLTFSMPDGLAEKLVETELITYKGAEDWDIDAFLFKPSDFDSEKRYPAIVWVHGGPMRQMRGSWHPSATYAHFYAYNQFLVSQGYIVLSPNFRGGIGYGKDFRYGLYKKKGIDDTIDIVNAGKYLKNLDYVDQSKVAVYGLSYGGYMTLHSLTQYPDEFEVGINIAGLWDIAQWGSWIEDTYGNYHGDANFCGKIEERPDLWAKGSPVYYKENLKKPLMNLQGTNDPNVDFEQLSSIVKDCVKLGAIHESIYYPEEMHTFRFRKTWEDALPRMTEFFNKYLK
jgi:dipeptidyl aminopeptidase/acylaminoacyl peptidase